jgi:pimeloyl-ACP methyl ester carboxylesterase
MSKLFRRGGGGARGASRAILGALSLLLASACSGAAGTSPVADAGASEDAAPPPPAPTADAAVPEAAPADAGLAELPCPQAPCAARPIVFVHGFTGSNDDWMTMLYKLVATDGRYDGYVLSGRQDHGAWADKSIERRRWLFAFDYYVEKKSDARGSYTAGPGRIGTNAKYACPQPMGGGHVVATKPEYDQNWAHEYSTDLAEMVDDVLRATGAKKVDIVAHSMGGAIARSYLAFSGGGAKVERMVLLASPIAGVSLAQLGAIVGLGEPWMAKHEMAELDSGGLASIKFVRCGTTDEGSWPSRLLAHEALMPIAPMFWVLSGQLDFLVSYGSSDHPQQQAHEVVPGADHAGILKADASIAKVKAYLGGTY